MTYNSRRFRFDGGAGTYLGTALLGVLITVLTFGICYPYALVLNERWRAKHSYIDGQRLIFTGSAVGLFGTWIKWLALTFLTLGIYLLWVGPRIVQWKWEHTDFDPTTRLSGAQGPTINVNLGHPVPPGRSTSL
ncbi:membrane protein [Terrabacter terrae]|uniref:Membrane protein n=1 Tax=Terrabacter terrae TaxID=318434 RepID=A0ABN1ZMR7_9MICO